LWVPRYSYLPEHCCIFWELGEDCDTYVVVAEGFLVEEQMISSKLEW
jgi:hypothetical protein